MKHLIFAIYFCLASVLAFAQNSDFPPRPNPPRLVNDLANMLSAEEEAALERKLVNYNDTTSTQIAIVTLTSIGGYAIDDYAARLGEQWGVGSKANDNGLLILVAKNERRVAIATGYGVEHFITDGIAKRITENILKPNFQQNNYYKGLDEATSRIFSLASGEYQADPRQQGGDEEGGPSIFFIIIIVMLIVFFISRRGGGGGRGGRRGARTLGGGPIFIPGGFGRGGGFGGGGFGGGGGGFGGFGGGSFGGGGASSSW
ncbi:TPM domain-containing protein [Pontibacter qinzhouensis]|uniref:TPM domain-containing protein n=1 Tax=Pontibacter qinzhouensis TaxID=2603253 RepID=A0A5C8KAA0_9BACT|nr:TPM domain-containing protein [Pontibacter qinzhouensis]TXK51968.1 TPM domain-containing protein [Pontibacter qinzhouensis]